MSTIWRNGREIDKDQYIADIEKEIAESQAEIEKLERADAFINEAIEEHFKTKYKSLDKVLKEYDGLEGMHEMYGYGAITKVKYEKYCNLVNEREEMRDTIQSLLLSRQIRKNIQSEREIIVHCRAKIKEVQEEEQ